MTQEKNNLHQTGVKDDATKIQTDLLLDFGLALMAVADLATIGAKLYTKNGWKKVPDGITRYSAAMVGHLLRESFEEKDPQTQISHTVAVAWNALAKLQLLIEEDPEWRQRLLNRQAQTNLSEKPSIT